MATFLVTGITGAIGIPLARELVRQGHRVVALVRAKPDAAIREKQLQQQFGNAVIPIFGDVLLPHCGVDATSIARFAGSIDVCIHAAGATQYHQHLEAETFATNLGGTQHVCELAEALEIGRIAYVSTCYVGGKRAYFGEQDVPERRFAHNPYEASKIEAESIVRRYPGQPVIIRLSTVIGRADTGEIMNVGGYAGFVSGFVKLRERLERYPYNPFWAPVNPDCTLNLVTNEWVTDLIIRAASSKAEGAVHLSHPHPVSMRQLFKQTFHTNVLDLPVSHDRTFIERTAKYDDRLWLKLQERVMDMVTYFGPYVTRDTTFGHSLVKTIPGYKPPPKITEAVLRRQMEYMVGTLFAKSRELAAVA